MVTQKRVVWILGTVVALLVGVFVVPKLMKKYTGKLYRNSHGDIDFNRMGPEVVKKDIKEVNKDGN